MRPESGLSLGCNLGDRLAALTAAKERIDQIPGVDIAAQSSVYETEPVGVDPKYEDMKFLNAVIVARVPMTVHEWFDALRTIEDEMGRERVLDRYAPRSMDIDIIYFGDSHVESGGLVIPHPHWNERRFVTQPLFDVRPDLVLPGEPRTVSEVLAALPNSKAVTLLTQDW